MAQRQPQVDALADQLRHTQRTTDRRGVLEFPHRAESLVHEFVGDESLCCSFLEFDVQRISDSVQLRVAAPEGAEHSSTLCLTI